MAAIKILAIETSCDETAAAVIGGQKTENREQTPIILSNAVASQIDLHRQYGGVFPELASRAHTEKIIPVIRESLEKAGKDLADIDAVAVTYGPGLIGSLLVGVAAAKTLAYVLNKPIIPINHWEGHIYANFIGIDNVKGKNKNAKFWNSPLLDKSSEPEMTTNRLPKFPALILTVSGGHTSLILMRGHGNYQVLGQTRDDAAGEAFDKVAKLLGLPYPGGPAIAAMAAKGKSQKEKVKGTEYHFPRPMIDNPGFDFSFSGLKTAVLYAVKDKKLSEQEVAEIAASFQEAVVETLIKRTERAAKQYQPSAICLAGGVSANKMLRSEFEKLGERLANQPSVHIPPMELTTDNAAMIGAAGYYRYLARKEKKWYDVYADANASLM